MKIVIIDTGCANLASVYFALQRLGYTAQISQSARQLQQADRLILPGVGSADTAMQQLQRLALVEQLQRCQQPLLGICLGMQLLAQHSEEQGITPLLGIIDHTVKKLSVKQQPLPHMGWDQVTFTQPHPLFKQITDQSYFYFVHSYALPVTPNTLACCHYGTHFSAVVQKDNFYGVQFHPERSAKAGSQLLNNFIKEIA